MNDRLAGFSSDRLIRVKAALGQGVGIVVKLRSRPRDRGQIRVKAGEDEERRVERRKVRRFGRR